MPGSSSGGKGGRTERSIRRRQPPDALSDLLDLEEFLESIAIEECGSLVALFGNLDLEPEEFSWLAQNPSYPHRPASVVCRDLGAKGVEDALDAPCTAKRRIQVSVEGPVVARELVAAAIRHRLDSIPAPGSAHQESRRPCFEV